jgi:hypothetical protein
VAFHAFHTLSFPWPAFRAANAGLTGMPPPNAMYRISHEMFIGSGLNASEVVHASAALH